MQSKQAKLMKTPDVAERTDSSDRTVRRWIEQGELKVIRLGRSVRISEEDFQDFLNRNRS